MSPAGQREPAENHERQREPAENQERQRNPADNQSHQRKLAGSTGRRRGPGCTALIVGAVLIVAGCGSANPAGQGGSAGHGAPNPALPFAPPMVMTISATPPDIPANQPDCTGYADQPLLVAADISGLVSACVSPAAYSPAVMVIYNLSDDVLDIRSATSSQPALRAYYPVSDDLLPSGDEIETYAQDESVRRLSPPPGTILLPVGGHVVATQDAPIYLTVQVDQYASAASYAAQLMTGYVVDNLTEELPDDSALSYEVSIADCVNGAHSLWQDLYQEPPADATGTMQTALSTISACQDLQNRVTSDHAEEISLAAADNRLTDQALAEDLAKVADTAGQVGWESQLEDLAKVGATVAEHVH